MYQCTVSVGIAFNHHDQCGSSVLAGFLIVDSLFRILAEMLWVSSLVVFFASSLSFYFLIDDSDVGSYTRSVLVILRVVLLDGLFLIMGIILGVCIIIVSLC